MFCFVTKWSDNSCLELLCLYVITSFTKLHSYRNKTFLLFIYLLIYSVFFNTFTWLLIIEIINWCSSSWSTVLFSFTSESYNRWIPSKQLFCLTGMDMLHWLPSRRNYIVTAASHLLYWQSLLCSTQPLRLNSRHIVYPLGSVQFLNMNSPSLKCPVIWNDLFQKNYCSY